MKNTLKTILAATLAGIITVCAAPVIADGIDAIMNSVNIKLNGEKVAAVNENYHLQNGSEVPFSILYEGTTYLPVRKLSELLDIGIDWDDSTRTVLIDNTGTKPSEGFDSWYGAPDFGECNGIKEINSVTTVNSTTHWYNVEEVTDTEKNKYIELLESQGYEKITDGGVKPKFAVYAKGNTEVWLDLGMYTKLVLGVTVVDTVRPSVGRDFNFSGSKEDIPNFGSAFGFSAEVTEGVHNMSGDFYLWSCLPVYFGVLEDEGFVISKSGNGYFGKNLTLKKNKTVFNISYNSSKNSTLPVLSIEY